MRDFLVQSVMDIARLAVPVVCPGCGAADITLCDACAALWWEDPLRCEADAGRLDHGDASMPVWSLAALEGPAHQMVSAWKDGSRRDLDVFFSSAIGRAATAIAASLPATPLLVVPAPARPASNRRRGVDLPALLAQAVQASLRDQGCHAQVADLLSTTGPSSRKASARHRWRHAKVQAQAWKGVPEAAVMVDDVITTGATIAACVRALRDRNVVVVGALTLASASPVGNSTAAV